MNKYSVSISLHILAASVGEAVTAVLNKDFGPDNLVDINIYPVRFDDAAKAADPGIQASDACPACPAAPAAPADETGIDIDPIEDIDPVEEEEAPPAEEPEGFKVGSRYSSETGKWVGRIATDLGNGRFRVALSRAGSNYETETRDFSPTPAGNLRSDRGSIVLHRSEKLEG